MIGFLRLINVQGVVGIAVGILLAGLLFAAKMDARHWKKQSTRFEQLYRGEQAAHRQTELNVRRATEQARAADKANADRVRREQSDINERTTDELENRLADARARADRLRRQAGTAASNPGGRGTASVSSVSAATGRADQPAGQDRLPPADALIATEQAIQLDELIKWVRRQAAVEVNGKD